MAKNLKVATTYTDKNGDIWDSAVLHVDYTNEDWLNQTITMHVCIYKDSTARTNRYKPLRNKFTIDRTTFLANFTLTDPISTLKSQCEDYSLTLVDPHTSDLYGDLFE